MKAKILWSAVFVAALLLSACSAAASPETDFAAAPQEMSAESESMSVEVRDAAAEMPPAAEGMLEAPAAQQGAGVAFATPIPISSSLTGDAGRMIIKDALLDLVVDNTDRGIAEVTNLAAVEGGYILSARSWYDGDQKYANLRLGVPSARFEQTLNKLRLLAVTVVSESASGQDVSAEYNDLASQLVNLEATAARVRTFLEEAKTVEESLKINATLSELERQIEQIKGQMKFYQDRSAYSNIEVNLSPLLPTPSPTPTPTQTPTPTPWSPGAVIKDASATSTKLWQSVTDAVLQFVVVCWPAILLAGLFGVIFWQVRKRNKAKAPPPATPPAE